MRQLRLSFTIAAIPALVIATACTINPLKAQRVAMANMPMAGDDVAGNIEDSLCDINECPPCVVQIQCKYGQMWGTQGTGVLLEDGRILTAAHVVRSETNQLTDISVILGGRNGNPFFDGAMGRQVRIKWTAQNADLAILAGVAIPDFAKGKGARIAANSPERNDLLTSVGLENLEAIRVHAAPVVGRDAFSPMLYVGVTAQSGDSGGPVFNRRGELVAINSAIGGFTQVDQQTIQLQNGQVFVWNARQIPCTFVIDLNHPDLRDFLE